MFASLRPFGSLRRFGSLVVLAAPEPPDDFDATVDPFRVVLIAAPDVPQDAEVDPYGARLIL